MLGIWWLAPVAMAQFLRSLFRSFWQILTAPALEEELDEEMPMATELGEELSEEDDEAEEWEDWDSEDWREREEEEYERIMMSYYDCDYFGCDHALASER